MCAAVARVISHNPFAPSRRITGASRHKKSSGLGTEVRAIKGGVELEGLEPSSKRGTNVLSTCVVSSWFSWHHRLETANNALIPYLISDTDKRHSASYSRFNCTATSRSLGPTTLGRCLVSATVAEIKLIYYTSIKQQERSLIRHLKLSMSLIIERSHHCSARLHTTSTRCQNRSAP